MFLHRPLYNIKIFLADFECFTRGTATLVTGLKPLCVFDSISKSKIMTANIVTMEDLQTFKRELLEEIKGLLSERSAAVPTRRWLKSHEVRRLLTISPGTLQHLRVNGTLPFTKIGGVIFYDQGDVQKMLEGRKSNFQTSLKRAA
jgi:hypothetical protein